MKKYSQVVLGGFIFLILCLFAYLFFYIFAYTDFSQLSSSAAYSEKELLWAIIVLQIINIYSK